MQESLHGGIFPAVDRYLGGDGTMTSIDATSGTHGNPGSDDAAGARAAARRRDTARVDERHDEQRTEHARHDAPRRGHDHQVDRYA
jgi:hypothetical protein